MEHHSYIANEFGITLLYERETILIVYDYAFLNWRLVIVPVNRMERVESFPLDPNIDPFIPFKRLKG